jgi:hypothetical protein
VNKILSLHEQLDSQATTIVQLRRDLADFSVGISKEKAKELRAESRAKINKIRQTTNETVQARLKECMGHVFEALLGSFEEESYDSGQIQKIAKKVLKLVTVQQLEELQREAEAEQVF